jgi:predicted O-linked N-acetylglucosamine transferase (SPINDLY family)
VVNPSPRQDPGRTVSPEFRKHPVGYLTAEIFESHDPDRFETYAFSIGPDDNSDLRKRLEKSFHRFVDCEHKLDGEVLKAIDDAQIEFLSILQAIRTMSGRRCSRPVRLQSPSAMLGSRERWGAGS